MSTIGTTDAAAVADVAPHNAPGVRPNHWWQWVMMYPTLAVAIVGAIPTYSDWYQAYKLGVPRAAVAYALEQNDLWSKNFRCTRSVSSNTFKTETNVELEVTTCPSGDMLVKVSEPDGHQHLRWLAYNSFVDHPSKAALRGTVSLDFGGSIVLAQYYPYPPPRGPTVICQFRAPNGLIIRRLRFLDGHCLEEAVNPYTGEIAGNRPVPCNAPC